MTILEQILAGLQTKFTGVDTAILTRIATKKAEGITDETKVNSIVEGISFSDGLYSYGDFRAGDASKTAVSNYEKKHNLKDGKSIENPNPNPNPNPKLEDKTDDMAAIIANAVSAAVKPLSDKIMTDLSRVFEVKAREFAIGSRLRSSGRAPYFHLLYWLSESKDWTIRMADIYLKYPTHKASISQVADKGFLYKLINNSENIKSVIHYDEYSKVLTVEDPKFMFYLQNLDWTDFVKRIGFSKINFDKKYDFALSFAGEVRSIVAELAILLFEEHECSVFYDFNEQHKIIGEDLTDYFEPIYKSDAEFIIVFLDRNYPRKLWTNFESDKFKERFGEHAVIPIIFKGCEPTQFDKLANIGYLSFDPEKEQSEQIKSIADIIVKKLDEKRRNEPS